MSPEVVGIQKVMGVLGWCGFIGRGVRSNEGIGVRQMQKVVKV